MQWKMQVKENKWTEITSKTVFDSNFWKACWAGKMSQEVRVPSVLAQGPLFESLVYTKDSVATCSCYQCWGDSRFRGVTGACWPPAWFLAQWQIMSQGNKMKTRTQCLPLASTQAHTSASTRVHACTCVRARVCMRVCACACARTHTSYTLKKPNFLFNFHFFH